jgi:alpha-tubulin suppressor-like RCC1 family protein
MFSIRHSRPDGRRRLLASWFMALAALAFAPLLTGCGGGGDAAPVVGVAGGEVEGPAGSRVTVPAGALASDTEVAITESAAGAPALPATVSMGSEVFALTPHGTVFSKPVRVRLPADPQRVAAGLTGFLYKTNASGGWERVPGAVVADGFVTAEVTSFSWFGFFAFPPTISTQPADAAVTEPAPASFEVTALGSPPFMYQWQRSNDGGTQWRNLAGASQRTLALASTSADPAGNGGDDGALFRVIVSNPDGATTSQAASLSVAPVPVLPVITTQPASLTVAPGVDAPFSVRANGNGLVYQWQRSNDGGVSWADLAGQTNASLLLTAVQLADDGAQLRVQVSNAAGPTTSAVAVVTVVATPPPPAPTGSRIAAGYDFSAFGLNPGSGASWGSSTHLGAGDGLPDRLVAGPMPLVNAIAVAAGSGHGGAIDDQGRAWVWGGNSFGQLGTGNLNPLGTVTQNGFGSRYQAVALGSDHSLWLRTDGRIEAAGYNGNGALGQPDSVYLSQSLLVVPGTATYTAIAAGNSFSLAVRSDGTVWIWGHNSRGQYGTPPANDAVHRHTPVQVSGLPGGIRAVATGMAHSLALDSAGQVWAWGESTNGKLGIGSTTGNWAPATRVSMPGTFVAIACGAEFSLALRDDGVLFAWGIDETGQLGQGRSLGMSNLPLVVPGLPPIRDMDGGWGLGHALAVGQDGSLWAWGRNNAGQLGDGTRVDRNTPVQVLPPLSIP